MSFDLRASSGIEILFVSMSLSSLSSERFLEKEISSLKIDHMSLRRVVI